MKTTLSILQQQLLADAVADTGAVAGTVNSMVLSMLGARFRDISQLVMSLINVIFFVSPITFYI